MSEKNECCEFKVVSASSASTQVNTDGYVHDLQEIWQTEEGEEKASIVLELSNPTVVNTIQIGK